ncbi:MAG: hypothetical protein AAF328_11170 [Planctomycetota bacterium]
MPRGSHESPTMNPSGFARLGITTAIAALTAVSGSVAQTLPEVGFDRDDFLVSSVDDELFGGVFVLDADLSLKGRLANTPAAVTGGLNFDEFGRVVALVSPTTGTRSVRVLEPNGRAAPELSLDTSVDHSAVGIKVGPTGSYFIASVFPGAIQEASPNGELLRTVDTGSYVDVAVMDDGTIWGSVFQTFRGGVLSELHTFDASTGEKTRLFTNWNPSGNSTASFDGGQLSASTLRLDPTAGTVLIADDLSRAVYERAIDGELLTAFRLPEVTPSDSDLIGATRGPNGDVYAANRNTIYRFADDGTFLDQTTLDVDITAWNIVWAGNAPLFNALPGDFDGDGLVAQGDLNLVLSNWGTDPAQAGTIDDFVITAMLDGLVDQGELNAVLNHWGDATPPDLSGATVPEPAGAFALLLFSFIRPRRACVRRRPGAGGPGRSSSSRWCGGA